MNVPNTFCLSGAPQCARQQGNRRKFGVGGVNLNNFFICLLLVRVIRGLDGGTLCIYHRCMRNLPGQKDLLIPNGARFYAFWEFSSLVFEVRSEKVVAANPV